MSVAAATPRTNVDVSAFGSRDLASGFGDALSRAAEPTAEIGLAPVLVAPLAAEGAKTLAIGLLAAAGIAWNAIPEGDRQRMIDFVSDQGAQLLQGGQADLERLKEALVNMAQGQEPPELRPVQDGTIRTKKPITPNRPTDPRDRPGADGTDAYGRRMSR